MSPTTDPNVFEMTREEIVRGIEKSARRSRNMGASEFARAYRAGKIEEACEVADVIALVLLLSDDDPLFAAPV